MEILAVLGITSVMGLLYAALGLGFVIFVHELGHFAVAKWCGVRVERFSIGFGPVIWSVIKGETEYALSIIPFGGYVKMLGQDDVDPNQMTSTDVAKDPRSYSAKSVPQRMAIISAGVIMNIFTGTLFFAGAYMLGVKESAPVVGTTIPGGPAWVAGLQPGDRITQVNDREIHTFTDIPRGVILSQGPVELSGVHPDGEKFRVSVTPETKGKSGMRTVGIQSAQGLTLADSKEMGVAAPGTAAAEATPAFHPGDTIRRVAGEEIQNQAQLEALLAAKRDKTLEFEVERKSPGQNKPELVSIRVPSNPFRTIGLRMDMGQLAAVQVGSPAAQAKLEKGDRITHVISASGKVREVGLDLNPLELPDYLASLHGQAVTLKVKREVPGADAKELDVTLIPENKPGWVEHPLFDDSPLPAPAIGVAFYVQHTVLDVAPNSPAAKAGIKARDHLKKLELILPREAASDGYDRTITIEFADQKRNWPWAFWLMQECPQRKISLIVQSEGKLRIVELDQQPVKGWSLPIRGLRFEPLITETVISNPVKAVNMGIAQTRDFMSEIYLTLYRLVRGELPSRGLSGPIGIAKNAVSVASLGFSPLIFFLGYLSINLAVLNFLPIPLLDGGHMMFLLYEGLRGKPASERVLIAATYMGLAFVLSLMVFVLYLDIFVHWLKVG